MGSGLVQITKALAVIGISFGLVACGGNTRGTRFERLLQFSGNVESLGAAVEGREITFEDPTGRIHASQIDQDGSYSTQIEINSEIPPVFLASISGITGAETIIDLDQMAEISRFVIDFTLNEDNTLLAEVRPGGRDGSLAPAPDPLSVGGQTVGKSDSKLEGSSGSKKGKNSKAKNAGGSLVSSVPESSLPEGTSDGFGSEQESRGDDQGFNNETPQYWVFVDDQLLKF